MKDENKINKEVEKTLNLLNSIDKLEADAFFYTRVKAKKENLDSDKVFSFIFNSSVLKSALAAIVLIINISAYVILSTGFQKSLSADEAAELFNQEFFITQASDSYFELKEE